MASPDTPASESPSEQASARASEPPPASEQPVAPAFEPPPASEQASKRARGPRRLSRRKLVRYGIALAVLAVGAGFGLHYWRESRLFVSTDNAYVYADTVTIAAQVGGQVVRVFVRDNQKVAEREPLFDIDSRPYELALAKAKAQLELARQNESQEGAAVAAARAQLAQRQAELENARSNERRTSELVASGFLSKQGGENARTQAVTAEAAVRAAAAAVRQAESAHGQSGEQNAAIQAASAAVAQAQLDLEHTHVKSPVDGTVANLTLQAGNTVQSGAPLFSIISDRAFYVDANFKETELERVRPGQNATIELDMYPDHPFQGRVESLSGGSGAAFSLLPPQNATGNWVKVTQRVPVRIRVLDPDPAHPLRVGTTATVRVRVG